VTDNLEAVTEGDSDEKVEALTEEMEALLKGGLGDQND
jgi:hypothetical protein